MAARTGRTISNTVDTTLTSVFKGHGFTLRYPHDASVTASDEKVWDLPGEEIDGPPVRRADGYVGPGYILVISTYSNAGARSLDQWVDSVRAARNHHDFDPESISFLHAPDTVHIAGQRVLHLRPWCGDCQPHEYYFAHGRTILGLSFTERGLEALPPDDARRMYDKIMGTLQWSH